MTRSKNRALLMSVLVLAPLPLCCVPTIFDQPGAWPTIWPTGTTAVQAWTAQAAPSTTQNVMSLFITNAPRPRRTATKTSTPTPSAATVRVNTQTNCRTGPSIAYDVVNAFKVGQTAEVVGKNIRTHYWVIKLPGSAGSCWLWDQYVTVSGDTRTVPEMKPPPILTVTKSAPLIPIRPSNTPYSP